jgi:ATP-dependent helicase/nuclease subunit A
MSARVIPETVRALQIVASDPNVSAFVAANAGAGKTHVLAQRVIRLLLAGVDPAKILCITFTKAAAANMAKRVFDTLGRWVTLDDTALDNALREIGATAIDQTGRALARRLFASALEAPGGLKVQTIHAFCTRLLQQFPFEANVSARFTVLDDRTEAELLDRASLAVLLDAAADPQSMLGRALAGTIAAAAESAFREVIIETIKNRDVITAWIATAGSVERAIAELSQTLGIAIEDTLEQVEAKIFNGPFLPFSSWNATADALATGSSNDQKQALRLRAAAASTGTVRVEAYLSLFFNDDGGARRSLITRLTADKFVDVARRLAEEQTRLPPLLDRHRAVKARDRTAALLIIAEQVLGRYRREKDRQGLLDYDDLIEKTQAMLATVNPTWVHYKLDLGIDHMLIDEAQDTSPKQWEIISRLVSEFTAGSGARGRRRTIFAVGDEKQSIFSFQGAVPDQFEAMHRKFSTLFKAAERDWRDVRLQHSFRSGANVLASVDQVFAEETIFTSITTDKSGAPRHESLPKTAPGVVEVWPLISAEDRRELEGWDAPFDELAETSPQVRLAHRIAANVKMWMARGTGAGEVLVLVRQRGPLFEAIIRALKERGVPVAGADRLVLTEHIAVIDLLSLADALLLPADDLALAVALKSPIFGLDDEQLFRLAWNRRGTLLAALNAKALEDPDFADSAARLERCMQAARLRTPFAFYAWLLGTDGARCRFLARLGPEAADALDEFLELALDYERREMPTLQGFVSWMRAAATEIKRDMEITRDEVRVMTVHGAKGLEAPIVVLADTTTRPAGPRQPRLLRIPARNAVPGAPDRVVWAGTKDSDVSVMAEERRRALTAAEDEYRRLLYVAMTRAANRLIICGIEGRTKRPERCWYDLVFGALKQSPALSEEAADDGDGTVWRYRAAPAETSASPSTTFQFERPSVDVPAWLRRDAPETPRPGPRIAPSAAIDDTWIPPRAAGAPNDRRKARLRGVLIHRLMQSLPEVELGQREATARRFLQRSGQEFTPSEQDALRKQVSAVLSDSRFTALFAGGSRGEVPIVGRIQRAVGAPLTVSGQVDRLVITPKAVLIADYKTNRPAPKRLNDVPPAYITQLALYRAVLATLYPERTIRAALIWTDVPDLMELSAEAMDAAVARLIAA